MESDSPQTFGSRLTSESRRRFLRAVGATTLLAGSGGLAVVAQEGDGANDDDAGDDDAGDDGTDDDRGVETVALDARVDGWRGVVPDPIDGETNPALDVAAGETYRVVWRNDDGEPHNFSVVDEAGGTLPVLRVLDVSSEEAAPVFEASGGTVRTGENLEIVAIEDDDDDDRGTDDDDDQDDRGTATDDDRDDDADDGTDDDDDDGGTETDDDDDDGDDDDDATETGTAGMETGDDVVTDTPADLMAVTETISQDGAIQAVEFEVTEEMAQYQCQVHPGSMVGDLEVSTDDDNDDNDDDGTDDDNDDGGDDDNDDNNDDNDDGGDNNNDGTDDDNDDNNDEADDNG